MKEDDDKKRNKKKRKNEKIEKNKEDETNRKHAGYENRDTHNNTNDDEPLIDVNKPLSQPKDTRNDFKKLRTTTTTTKKINSYFFKNTDIREKYDANDPRKKPET